MMSSIYLIYCLERWLQVKDNLVSEYPATVGFGERDMYTGLGPCVARLLNEKLWTGLSQ